MLPATESAVFDGKDNEYLDTLPAESTSQYICVSGAAVSISDYGGGWLRNNALLSIVVSKA